VRRQGEGSSFYTVRVFIWADRIIWAGQIIWAGGWPFSGVVCLALEEVSLPRVPEKALGKFFLVFCLIFLSHSKLFETPYSNLGLF
jgi:hypothetical protein